MRKAKGKKRDLNRALRDVVTAKFDLLFIQMFNTFWTGMDTPGQTLLFCEAATPSGCSLSSFETTTDVALAKDCSRLAKDRGAGAGAEEARANSP